MGFPDVARGLLGSSSAPCGVSGLIHESAIRWGWHIQNGFTATSGTGLAAGLPSFSLSMNSMELRGLLVDNISLHGYSILELINAFHWPKQVSGPVQVKGRGNKPHLLMEKGRYTQGWETFW